MKLESPVAAACDRRLNKCDAHRATLQGHDAAARAEAAVSRWRGPRPATLAGAGGGLDLPGGKWARVRGPHLRALRMRHARNRTGCPGISFGVSRVRRRDGSVRVRHFFYVSLGSAWKKFCIEALGRNEAWRRALKLRAEWETRIRQANAAILAARSEAAAGGARGNQGEAA